MVATGVAFAPSIELTDPTAPRRYLLVHPRGLVAHREGSTLTFLGEDEVRALGVDPSEAHVLGMGEGHTYLTAPLAVDPPAPLGTYGLRALAGMLEPELFGVAGRAMHVVDWATTSRYCGRCGALTARVVGERCLRCPACAQSYYPRIAPAVIVLVRRGPLALLAQNARFPGAFYSTLAGFSEIGESLEETLVREVHEEVGLRVGSLRYFGSQPWPFPHSLMIGFTAEWESGDIVCEPGEISDAQWFSADALPTIPPPLSIARRLIDAWVAEVGAARG